MKLQTERCMLYLYSVCTINSGRKIKWNGEERIEGKEGEGSQMKNMMEKGQSSKRRDKNKWRENGFRKEK